MVDGDLPSRRKRSLTKEKKNGKQSISDENYIVSKRW